jgi:hypothetical protein
MKDSQNSQTSEFDMSLDIETLGREPGCTVMSIGATMFDPFGIDKIHEKKESHFYVVIDSFDCQNKGFNSDPKTLQWWKKQKIWETLSSEIMNSNIGVLKACKMFSEFMADQKPKKVWANSPTFDIEIMRAMFRKVQVDFPVHYRQEMDFRTCMELSYPNRDDRPKRPDHLEDFQPHHALGDAILQAHQIIQAHQNLALLPQDSIGRLPANLNAQAVVAGMSESKKDELIVKLLLANGAATRLSAAEMDSVISTLIEPMKSKSSKSSIR